MARCKLCGHEIEWIASQGGRPVPVEPDPIFVIEGGGMDMFLDDMGAAIIGRRARTYEERRDLPVAFVPHNRLCATYIQKAMPPACCLTDQAVDKTLREFNSAMKHIAQVAKALGEDAGEMEREAAMLATASTMTQAEAMYYVANKHMNEARQKGGGGYGGLPASP